MQQLFVQLLEERYFNRLPEALVLKFATESADFVRFWLVHCLRSMVSERELAIALFFSAEWELEELASLKSFWGSYVVMADLQQEQSFKTQFCYFLPWLKTISPRHADAIRVFSALLAFDRRPTSVGKKLQSATLSYTQLPVNLLDDIKRLSLPHLRPITVYGHQGKGSVETGVRNNMHYPTPIPNDNIALACAERVIAKFAGIKLAFAEPIVVLRYETGQFYQWHYDAIHAYTDEIQAELERFGQRSRTAILYLNDDFQGGETEFKAPYIQVKPPPVSGLLSPLNNHYV
ncbi:prolyl 4-hydroxylase, alpha subunit domain protein [Shewanella sp. W3-18-1]|uniref:2OG-Fe(II) oxygenase n=1 Tax=Shewanella sp. (strain W3-18-1) TaxID=351745 RepID=UPI00005FDD8A|nr:2OG-Fe(II) oxygenase [Shewanella sp. W3-18-1]ABM23084.1 prolyl 4-hydroxylase, alpha subunit domain protein [Shewanella sp. W3-18-1]